VQFTAVPVEFRRHSKAGALAVVLLASAATLFAQSKPQVPQSELAKQNMARVAASVSQIVTILHGDPGLLVELKKLIARDATNNGQLISDSDLTDEAILDRLENDITFRAEATELVQKYGYLQPTVNPASPMAKEQELLMRERVRLLAQEQEQQRNRSLQTQTTGQPSQACDRNGNCPQQPTQRQTSQQQAPTNQAVPEDQEQELPAGPSIVPPPPQRNTDVTQLLRTSGQDQESSGSLGETAGSAGPSSPYDESSSGSGQGTPGLGSTKNQEIGNEFEDLSLTSDFASEQLSPSPGENSSPTLASSLPPSGTSGNSEEGGQSLTFAERRARASLSPGQRMVRRANPYKEVPSLYDMYLQASAHPAAVQRFGMQVFENGTRNQQMIPFDLPVGPDYVLGPGDGLSIDLWGGVSRRFYRVVDREGRVALPEVGPQLVAGKSLADVQESFQKTLRTQFRDVSADVSLSRLRTVRVYVVGDVLHPGAYDISSLSTPLNALFAAGGPTGNGSLRIVKHFRGNQLVQDVDVYDLLLHGVKGDIERLESGDTVLVPPLSSQITIEGMVRRPAIYEQKDEKSLAEAFALAGGLLPSATLRHVEVQRVVAHEKQTMLSLDIPADAPSAEVTKQLESFQIQDGDKIRVFPIAAYAQDAVYLEGHVIRPGKYSYKPGMRVTDLISSYKDLLPEPALQYGEIIRLSAPDFRPTVESFDVEQALSDPKSAPELKPLDTIQIFGRYDFEDPPSVSVWGDVRDPGTYRTSGDIHLSDAIHLAGGLEPDAATDDAQVFRYMPDSTLKILDVKLSGALDGSPQDNIILSKRDRVLVHRNPAAVDPATVLVKGEVERPGRYPLTTNMRISDLIRVAGGLKQSADTNSADLTHYFWKDDKQVTGKQQEVLLADAMLGDPAKDSALNNGDVLTIRQVPGWNDLGASITLRGEVAHPGTYGIRPGERLSSVLMRAGGFAPGAYPYGAVLMRTEVQKLEQRSYGELVQRVREQQATLKLTASSTSDPDQKLSAESAFVQWQTTIDNLLSSPPTGRVSIQVSSNIKSWANTARDVPVRSGDVLVVPKRPSYVLVQGQVYGPTAVAYRPGKSANWYLTQAGGMTNMANKHAVFVVRADGTVVGSHSSFWISGGALSVPLQPGDMVVAPEKALGGPPIWKTLFQNAQVLSSITTSAILAAHY
jgi:protein involved in polysaccharide export with SLBB domain